METILQGLLDLAGVSATMVFDGTGQLVGYRGHAVYDRPLCEQVSKTLMKAIDSIQLQQEDWESIAAQFADGKLLLRNLGAGSGGRTYVLAVVADATLNASFATVAIRVAANKLKKAVDGGSASQIAAASSTASPAGTSSVRLAGTAPPPAASSAAPADSRPVLANSGLSWSKVSSVGMSGITVADPASSAFLTRCAKELARHVGPISKVYIQEAVRRIAPDAVFSMSLVKPLVEDLAGQIEDPQDQVRFRTAIEKT